MASQASSGLEIRPANGADLTAVLELDRAIAEAPHWSLEAYAAFVTPQPDALLQRCLFLAKSGGELAGFAAASYLAGDDNAGLESIAVASAWRGRRVADALIRAIKPWARQQGAAGLGLEVRSSNHRAIRFYRRTGFTRDGIRPQYYRQPDEDGLLMSLLWGETPGQSIQPEDL